MAVLIDTSVLLATLFARDKRHREASMALQSIKDPQIRFVPAPVLQELFYLAVARINYARAITIRLLKKSEKHKDNAV